MSSTAKFLDSSIGRKVLMSLTGLFLCSFLLVHVSGNLQLFKNDQGLAFNQYSLFMTTFPVIKIISYLLYASILLHVINGIRITLQNKKARPVAYQAPKDTRSATWASKNMALMGIIVLIFLVTHMANFWYKYKFGDVPWVQYNVELTSGDVLSKVQAESTEHMIPFESVTTDDSGVKIKQVVVRDLYAVVEAAFKQTWIVVLYLLGVIALAYHLVHGFQSAFQTLGIRHPNFSGIIRGLGVWFFGIIIPLLFAAMPVYFFFM